jgi:hypothetical protein
MPPVGRVDRLLRPLRGPEGGFLEGASGSVTLRVGVVGPTLGGWLLFLLNPVVDLRGIRSGRPQ